MAAHKTKLQRIIEQCGHWAAARYLLKRGYSMHEAYWLIFGKPPRV